MATARMLYTLLACLAIVAAVISAPKEFVWVVIVAAAIVCGLAAIAHSIKIE